MGVVRELYGVMAAKGAAGGFVVTSGSFTEEATAFAGGRNVTLVDGSKLFGLIQQAKAARSSQGRVEAPGPRHTDHSVRLGRRSTRGHLPDLLELDGAADLQTRRQRGQRFLGLHRLPLLQRHALNRRLGLARASRSTAVSFGANRHG